jgi:hypothetical protein
MNAISKWAMALMLLWGVCAHAQQCNTLIYQGAPMTAVTGTGAPPLSSIPRIVGVATLSVGLEGGLTNASITPLFWDFSMTDGGFSSANEGTFVVAVSFTTTPQGQIVGWNFDMGYSGSVYSQHNDSSTQNGDTITVQDTEVPTAVINWTATNTTPGTWSCVSDLIAQLTTANQMIEALEAELNSMHANNVYMAKLLGRK